MARSKRRNPSGNLSVSFHFDAPETEDELSPSHIEHRCDEVIIDGRLAQRYNHLIYTFERDGVVVTARAYFDEIETVSLLGCRIAGAMPYAPAACPEALRNDVIGYLKRRYVQVDELTSAGYVPIKT